MMITAEDALKSWDIIHDQTSRYILHLVTKLDPLMESEDNKRVNALNTLRQFIIEQSKSEIKVVYVFKLYRTFDGLFMDRSHWSKSGKTYNKRNHMNAGIFANIERSIDKMRPRYYIGNTMHTNPEFDNQYRQYEAQKQDKQWRASFIPDDWIVRCIPVNTKADIIEMTAKEFYLGKEIT